jgi:hypothetical protein
MPDAPVADLPWRRSRKVRARFGSCERLILFRNGYL